MKRASISLISLSLVAGSFLMDLQAASARADDLAGTIVAGCEIHLDVWPTTSEVAASDDCDVGSNTLPNNLPTDGVATGIGLVNGIPVVCVPACSFAATQITYHETCPGPVSVPPVLGFASGQLVFNGIPAGGFDWMRIGTTAVVRTDDLGTGIAWFQPDFTQPGIGTCAQSGDLTVHVVGILGSPSTP